ncbi:unnamed protein product [Prunus armeniaca]
MGAGVSAGQGGKQGGVGYVGLEKGFWRNTFNPGFLKCDFIDMRFQFLDILVEHLNFLTKAVAHIFEISHQVFHVYLVIY